MSKGLFKNLPIIEYNGKLARNLMVSSKVVDDTFNNPNAFLKYTVEDDESPEEVAFNFYGSVFFSWLVLMSNKILDVYNEWPKSYKQLTNFYVQKYGSVPAAKETILHYSNPKYGFTINQDTFSRYSNSDFVDATISIDRTGWEPVTAFEYHEERNDNLRNIDLIDPSFIDQVQEEVERLFNG
jgi:hypothetical protein